MAEEVQDFLYENNKKYPFSFAKMNKYYLFPFFVPIVCFATKFCTEKVKKGPEEKSDIKPDVEHTFVFVYTIINSSCHILGGLLYFVSILRTTSLKKLAKKKFFKKKNEKTFRVIIIKPNNNKCEKFKIAGILFGMALILDLYNGLKGYALNQQQLEKRLYFLFFFTLFNVCFMKKIYKHQKVSLLIAGLGMFILFIIYFIYLDYSNYHPIYDILLFFGSFLYSLYLVLVKYLTLNHGMSPFSVLLFIGLISTSLTMLGFSSFSYYKKRDFSYITNVFHCSDENYVCFGNYRDDFIIYFAENSVLQVLIYLVIYYFSPEVFAISDIISPMLSFIQKCIKKKIQGKTIYPIQIIFNSFGYLIVLLGAFIYNEIIILNFYGLSKNTWKNIDLRGEEDLDMDLYSDSNSIGEYIIEDSKEIELKKKDGKEDIFDENEDKDEDKHEDKGKDEDEDEDRENKEINNKE